MNFVENDRNNMPENVILYPVRIRNLNHVAAVHALCTLRGCIGHGIA